MNIFNKHVQIQLIYVVHVLKSISAHMYRAYEVSKITAAMLKT